MAELESRGLLTNTLLVIMFIAYLIGLTLITYSKV